MQNHQNPMEGWWKEGFLTQDQLDQLSSSRLVTSHFLSCGRLFFFTRFLPVSHPLRVAPAIARGKSLLSHQRLRHVSHLHLGNTPLQEEFLKIHAVKNVSKIAQMPPPIFSQNGEFQNRKPIDFVVSVNISSWHCIFTKIHQVYLSFHNANLNQTAIKV